jgi:amino acid adenylation domain-containing protein
MAGLRADALTGRVSDFERVCVHEMFQRRAARTPDAVAMRFGPHEVSYAELDGESNRVAHALREHGVGRETLVGILLDRSPELVTAILATLKAGGTYVPLDPHFPPARLRQILADCRPPVVLTSERLRDRADSIPTIALDAGETIVSSQPTTCPEQVADVFAASIYVIYTSGSTGRPKGIVQLHEALSNLTQWQLRETEIDFAGNVLQLSSPGFDVHLQEIFGTLAAGGTICLLEHADAVDPRRLLARAEEHQINTMFLSVSTLTRMFATDSRLASLPESLSDLVTAGEQLYLTDTLAAWLQRRPHVRLHNHYGVSESHVVTSSTFAARDGALPAKPPIGRAISNVRLALLDARRQPVPDGEPGEIWIAGPCLARHYLNDPAKTARHWIEVDGERWYRTGDLARLCKGDELEFVGRLDDQVKIRGHLVEPGDVEAALRSLPSISECVVAPRRSAAGEVSLVGWYTPATPVDEVRGKLAQLLPEFMVPTTLVPLERLPIGATGKVDRSRLPQPAAGRPSLGTAYRPASSETERTIAAAIAALLHVESIGVDDNFFDLGADSLTLATAAETISERLGRSVEVLRMYETPTVRALAVALSGRQAPATARTRRARPARAGRGYDPIAIVGMAGRFPSCDSVEDLWRSLLAGRECLEDVEESERERSPVLPTEDAVDRVRHLGLLRDAEMFDSGFFGIPHEEAVWTDPQQRVFLECAWAALEDAGCVPGASPRIGVFAGAEVNTYLMHLQPKLRSMADYLRALVATDKDFLATRVAYRLGLEGPAMTVQTACSTSLVAVHMACRSLADGECDGALAGGVSIQLPQRAGHLAPGGLIYSPDGRTRPFDRRADGTNMTNGVALVVLKRLEDAMRDRDHVHAVIVGSAVNNDGARKVGYVAPSVRGQAEVVADALDAAGATADTIDFIEAHGTATPMGDAIEIAALTEVFRRDTSAVGGCALGSIKGNVGHLNRAAGVTGLIKAALAIEHGTLPPTCGHEEPSPDLHLDQSPFFVVTEPHGLRDLGRPRRAGVSSFGIGGTNAHVVLEQAPTVTRGPAPLLPRPFTLSARSPAALRARARQLAERLERDPPARIDDVALTLNAGRVALPHRRAFVAASPEEAVAAAREISELLPDTGAGAGTDGPQVAFVFPGQGAQRLGGGRDAYRTHPVFRAAFDEFADHVAEVAEVDIRRLVTGDLPEREARERLASSLHAQCLLVGLSRATAMLLMDWGVRPAAVLGHSTGEYAAACVAGSLSAADCALLVATRGRLMDELAPRGAMVSVSLSLEQARRYEGDGVWMAASNARGVTVLAGALRQVERLERRLERDGVQARRLSNRNPNHTPLMGAMADPLAAAAEPVTMRPPALALLAGATGEWVDGAEIDPVAHWVQHLCRPVLFTQALDALLDHGVQAIVECGPGRTLLALAADRVQADIGLHATLGGEADGEPGQLAATLGSLWQDGAAVDWSRFHHDDGAVRLPLPTYPFERRRAWVAPPEHPDVPSAPAPVRNPDPARWLYVREWSRTRHPIRCEREDLASGVDGEPWLLVGDGGGLGAALARLLRDAGATVEVAAGSSSHDGSTFDLAGGQPADYERLARHLRATGARPTRIVHVAAAGRDALDPLLSLARLLASCRGACAASLEVCVATRAGIAAAADEIPRLDRVGVGALRIVGPQEDPTVTCRQVDLDDGVEHDDDDARVLLDEVVHGGEVDGWSSASSRSPLHVPGAPARRTGATTW